MERGFRFLLVAGSWWWADDGGWCDAISAMVVKTGFFRWRSGNVEDAGAGVCFASPGIDALRVDGAGAGASKGKMAAGKWHGVATGIKDESNTISSTDHKQRSPIRQDRRRQEEVNSPFIRFRSLCGFLSRCYRCGTNTYKGRCGGFASEGVCL